MTSAANSFWAKYKQTLSEEMYKPTYEAEKAESLTNKTLETLKYHTDDNKKQFNDYFENKAAFERVHLPVLYGELENVSSADLDKAQHFLAEIRKKAEQVVEKVKDRKSKYEREDESRAENDEDDRYSYFHEEKKIALEDAWFDKLQETVQYKSWDDGTKESEGRFYSPRSGIYGYIKALDHQVMQLEKLDTMLIEAQQKINDKRNSQVGSRSSSKVEAPTITFGDKAAITVHFVPRDIRMQPNANIDRDALQKLQDDLNNRLPTMMKQFSALKVAPLVRVDVVKNQMLISIQEITPEMLNDNIHKLAKIRSTAVEEAKASSAKTIASTLTMILKVKYNLQSNEIVNNSAGISR